MDLLLGRYAEARIGGMDEAGLTTLEELLDVEEKDLFAWLTNQQDAPARLESGIVGDIRRFHAANPVSEG